MLSFRGFLDQKICSFEQQYSVLSADHINPDKKICYAVSFTRIIQEKWQNWSFILQLIVESAL